MLPVYGFSTYPGLLSSPSATGGAVRNFVILAGSSLKLSTDFITGTIFGSGEDPISNKSHEFNIKHASVPLTIPKIVFFFIIPIVQLLQQLTLPVNLDAVFATLKIKEY